jgi:hypothetical protein
VARVFVGAFDVGVLREAAEEFPFPPHYSIVSYSKGG